MAELNPSAPAFYPSSFFCFYYSFSTTLYYPPLPPPPEVCVYYPMQTYYSQVLSPPPPPPPPPPLLLSPPSFPQASPFSGNISKPSKRPFRARFGFGKGYIKARIQTDFKKWSASIKSEWRPKEEEEEEYFLPDNLEKEISDDTVQSKSVLSEPINRLGKKTTVMIRNIPNRYTKDMLLKLLDKHCMEENSSTKNKKKASAYDFAYLPIDFESKCNKGYAFVNFTEPVAVWRLNKLLQNHKWGILNSKKICEVNYARLQGIEALKEQFEKTTFVCETDEYLPTYFSPPRDGSAESVEQFVVGKRVNPLNAQ